MGVKTLHGIFIGISASKNMPIFGFRSQRNTDSAATTILPSTPLIDARMIQYHFQAFLEDGARKSGSIVSRIKIPCVTRRQSTTKSAAGELADCSVIEPI
ncbi:hypothetical protein HGRIS_005167 [Hohenbuehelia grisea]|uniref:Uncharacterized protein n=1 Tax=Hohenbuehelia grisea TaxID=104357 RepID=A0ABR3JFN7_9AGAR